jgi:hypothetical protein
MPLKYSRVYRRGSASWSVAAIEIKLVWPGVFCIYRALYFKDVFIFCQLSRSILSRSFATIQVTPEVHGGVVNDPVY